MGSRRIRWASVEIHTFHEPSGSLTLPQVQYSLPFPVAVALVRGKLGPSDIDGAPLRDPTVLYLARRITMIEDEALSARFPALCQGRDPAA